MFRHLVLTLSKVLAIKNGCVGVSGMSFLLSLQHSTDPFCPNSTPNPSVKTQIHQFWSIHGYTVYPDPNIRADWSITFHAG